MDERPPLDSKISLNDFLEFYWLKQELVDFCRLEQLRKSGSKSELTGRISHFLQSGEKEEDRYQVRNKSKSKFDWHSSTLTLQTKITNSYKNTNKVRRFFEKNIGKKFKFNVVFMKWMKENEGKTLSEAIDAWTKIKASTEKTKGLNKIGPQFEYNQYIRDFLKDNPKLKKEDAIRFWNFKKSIRGNNKYTSDDIKMKK